MRWHGTDPETRLVLAEVTDSQHGTLEANPEIDYLGAFDELDLNVRPTNLMAIQQGLEGRTIPGQHISAAMRFRNVLRRMSGVLQLQQRVWGIHHMPPWPNGRLVVPGRGLLGRLNELPPQAQAALDSAADQFRLNKAGLGNAASPMRQVFNDLGVQFESRPFTMSLEWI
jgi:hypothetical protein